MSEILSLILKWVVPTVCAAALTSICLMWKRTKAISDGLQSLLRAEIIRNYKEYTVKGYCPVYAREALNRTYKAYHQLGGNDVATNLYETVIELPTEQ